MSDTDLLSADEQKYFETKGKTELVAPEPEKPAETPAPDVNKVLTETTETIKKEIEAKQPTEIEVIDEKDADSVEPDARKYIKVGVLRKEREAKKQLKLEAEQLRQAKTSLEQRLQALEQPSRQLQPEEVPQVALQEVQQLKQQLQEREARQNFIQTYAQKAQEFTAEHDDFPQAYQHALGMRRAIYETAGYAPQQVAALLESEEAAIVERAMLDGVNPAERIYQIAQKLGYAKPEPKADAVTETVDKQAKTADATLKAAEKLEKIAKGMEKNKNLSGGGSGDQAPSLEELANMDEDAFIKATSGRKFRELMGG